MTHSFGVPELPEVEYARGLLDRVAVGRTIVQVHCADDAIVFDDVEPNDVCKALDGRRIDAAQRRGKHLWLALDTRPWPTFHFGMTGAFRVRGEVPLELESSPKTPDMSWPPRFTKIHIVLDDGGEIAMTNARRLGRIRLRNDPATEPPIGDLGFDPLLDLPSATVLVDRLRRRKKTIKGVLLDQSFAAGVGNWIADEVLYQARIDPRRLASDLAENEVRALRSQLSKIVRAAVRVDARKDRLPKQWLFHRRWGKAEGATTADGAPIEFITVAGRTTAWVPTRQR